MNAVRTATALLVDDNAASRLVNQVRLENDGYNVVVATDKAAALDSARRSAPNVIFIHLTAGRASSLPLIEALRSDDACRHMPVVVLTDQSSRSLGQVKLRPVNRDLW